MESLCKSDSKTLECARAKKAFFLSFPQAHVHTGANLSIICPTVSLFVLNHMANLDYLNAN